MTNIVAVDLFCGAGGLTKGLINAGIQVVAGVDIDPACRYPYEENNNAQYLQRDIRTVRAEDLEEYYPKGAVSVLAGCAPCQPFSTHAQKNKKRRDDDKWFLLRAFAKLIVDIKPSIVSMENVPRLMNETIFDEFVATLEEQGYEVTYGIAYGPDYGIPQERRRLVLLASRLGPIGFLEPTTKPENYLSVRDAIGGLKPLRNGECDKNDNLHVTRTLSEINLKRMKASKPGGTWSDWPEELLLDCYKKMKEKKTYVSVYGRMEWRKPSPTITTQFFNYGTGRFGHPSQCRALSLREGALLQTFPKGYRFVPKSEKVRFEVIGRLIGNAVPVKLGAAIGRTIRRHVEAVYE